jgi:hypothetical protein
MAEKDKRFPCHFYIDESGNPYLTHESFAEGHRFFVLLGMAIPASVADFLSKQVDDVCHTHFPGCRPEEVYIKSTRIRLRKRPFDTKNTKELGAFTDDLYDLLLSNMRRIRLFAFVIDKESHVRQYARPDDPYELGYKMLLERFVSFLNRRKLVKSTVFLDSRQAKGRESQDSRLRRYHKALGEAGTGFVEPGQLACIDYPPLFLDSRDSRLIQLVDLCAYNVYRVWAYDQPDYPYFQRILPLFDRGIYGRKPPLLGFGLKLFPQELERRTAHYVAGC